ncbi:LysR family transcriptional regulator [Chelatococcus reniformis]|uniref:LysR family transcriptional regulator n=1 Tax=Chelatococcus reniformis TaxID=1494448 RepID=A0A916UDE4_9HYPH|nr:LysR family transcriptional regulator [Chelatococcus reniformis]GGC68161.1 LysR family transcriptional regulator [Chelatococcus reniformis]
MDLDATPFRYFVTVADARSFTRAAAQLNVSQPALSAQIRELERRLGFALFLRTSRWVELTAEGRLFLANARRMVAEAAWANQAAREIRENELRIGAPLYTQLIPARRALLDRLIVAHPDIRLRIFDKSHARHYADLTRREADLALLVEPSDAAAAQVDTASDADWPEGFERLVLAERRLAIQVPAGHPWAAAKTLPFAALGGVRIGVINRALGAPLSIAITRTLSEAGVDVVRPPEGHAVAVERYGRLVGMPVVTLGWFDALPGGDGGAVAVPVEGLDLRTRLSLIRLQGEQRPAAALVWHMAEALAEPPGTPAQRGAALSMGRASTSLV